MEQQVCKAYGDVHDGYKSKTQPGGVMLGLFPDTILSSMELPMAPTKEKEGSGLLGLGWFGLGGRRLSHSSFINKIWVRSKSKRNKAIRKYLKGKKRLRSVEEVKT